MGKSRAIISKKTAMGWLFMLPLLAFMVYAVIIPFVWNIILSFQKWDGMSSAEFVGIKNYSKILSDPLVGKSLFNSVLFAVCSTVGAIVLGLVLATLVYKITDRSGSFFRLVLFSPAMMPSAVVGLLFTFMYNPEMGLINNFLKAIGLENFTHVWLQEKGTAMLCIIIVAIWKASGSVMLLCFAAMQTVPESLYESGKLDGAGYWKQMMTITYPLIKPMILLSAMNTLGAQFKTYDLIYVMTQGGPGTLTYTVPMHMTKIAFSFGQFGEASALGVVFTVVVMVFIMLTKRVLRGEQYEY